MFTFKKPYGIFVIILLLFISIMIIALVVFRIIKGIDVFYPNPTDPPGPVSETAPLGLILFAAFAGVIMCLLVMIFIILLFTLFARKVVVYPDKIKLGKDVKQYGDFDSFKIVVWKIYHKEYSILKFYLKEPSAWLSNVMDIGISQDMDIQELMNVLYTCIPEAQNKTEAQ